MTRKTPNPVHSLSRFIHGIYDFYVDRGMPKKTAKARMMDNTLEECYKLMKQEEEVPDEMLVLMAQWMSKSLNSRGSSITRRIEKEFTSSEDVPENILIPLRKIKDTKDSIDVFIESYKGWGDGNGEKES